LVTAGFTGSSWSPRRPAVEDSPPARLIDGTPRGPLEDSGGFPGYEEIMDALADPAHPDYAEYSAWATDITGSDAPFDPALLDITAINRPWLRSSDFRSLEATPRNGAKETAPSAATPPPI
jgi:hypothetical protein